MKPRLLDLFCKAGGCTRGYQDAGFEVIGVDIEPQPRYIGDGFYQADALEVLRVLIAGGSFTDNLGRDWYLSDFAVIHASPPCQAYSVTASMHDNEYPELVEPVREMLIKAGRPYVIENVPGAPLLDPIVLWGPMFNLKCFRKRLFETNPWMLAHPPVPKPKGSTTLSSRGYSRFSDGATHITCVGNNFDPIDGGNAMGIDWMIRDELAEAIPPIYTRWIGERLLEILKVEAV